jgi:DNA modification methylase
MQAAGSDSTGPVFSTPSGLVSLFEGDCLSWLSECPPATIHGVLTDPPYGMLEYTPNQISKLRAGRGGVWRIPPAIGGHKRAPLPRFTVLDKSQIHALYEFFYSFGLRLFPALVPGAHATIASSPLFNHVVSQALIDAGFEKRGEIVRLVRTLRGGDRPKGAEEQYPRVSVMPRSSWEPWVLVRRPIEGTVARNLERWGTGALQRPSLTEPFVDVIMSGRTPRDEKRIAPHPSLKPQAFLRQVAKALLPLNEGVILDPFAGGGSTLAACEMLGIRAIGIEIDPLYVELAKTAIPKLARLYRASTSSMLAVHVWDPDIPVSE